MACDVKALVVRRVCLIMYWLHTTVIQRDRIREKIIPKIIFVLFVNLRMDSPTNVLLASKERVAQLEKHLDLVISITGKDSGIVSEIKKICFHS